MLAPVIIGGVATNVCCESTARDAFFRDFKVIFLTDGYGTFDHPEARFVAHVVADTRLGNMRPGIQRMHIDH